MSTILDALNKYKQEKEEREGAERDRERFLDGESGGGNGEPPEPPRPDRDPDHKPGGRSMALVIAMVAVFLIIALAAGGYLFYLVSRQNKDFSTQMVDARINQERLERELQEARKEREALAAKPTPVQTVVIHITPEPTPSPRPTPQPTPAPAQPQVAAAPAQQQGAPQDEQAADGENQAGGLRTVRGDAIGLNVGGVMWDPIDPACLINGNVLSEGETVEGYEVIKIDKQSIHLRKGTFMYRVLY